MTRIIQFTPRARKLRAEIERLKSCTRNRRSIPIVKAEIRCLAHQLAVEAERNCPMVLA